MKFIRGCQVAFAIVLSGCASAPKIQSISSINAIYPVVVGIGDEQAFVVVRESYPSFENVIFFRSVEVLALQQEKLGNGKLWISAQITNNTNPKWAPIEGLSGWSSTSLSTRAGEKTSALSTRLYWCPIDVNPEILATDCRITKKLHGTKYDKKITPKGPIYTGSPGYQDTFDVFGVQPGTRVKEVLDKAQLGMVCKTSACRPECETVTA